LDEYCRRDNLKGDTDSSEEEKVMNSSSRKASKKGSSASNRKKHTCNYCKKTGHKNHECRKLARDKKAEKEGGTTRVTKSSKKAKRDERDEKILTALTNLEKYSSEKALTSQPPTRQNILPVFTSISEPRANIPQFMHEDEPQGFSSSISMPILKRLPDLVQPDPPRPPTPTPQQLGMFNRESIFTTARVFDPMQEDEEVSYTSSSSSLSSLIKNLILTKSFKDLIPKLQKLSKGISVKAENRISSKDFNANFISDSGATCHIISSLKYFTSFKKLDEKIHWGNASSLDIQSVRDVRIKFRNTRIVKRLKNCFLVPQLGVNILSSSKMKNHFVCTFPTSIIIADIATGNVITKGAMLKGLYYLPVEVLQLS
jgi:hypothetical protein